MKGWMVRERGMNVCTAFGAVNMPLDVHYSYR
jgi:hypothetical protein